MLIGYARSPKAGIPWVLDLQRDALLAAGVTSQKLFEDPASGLNDDHPGLAECLTSLRTGDTLVVWKLDRLGADLPHLVNLVHDLSVRGIGLKVLTGEGAPIDTAAPDGRLVSGFFAALAECERELLAERTPPGPARARGKPRKMTAAQLLIAQAAMQKPETKVSGLCAELDISAQTLYRYFDPLGELRPNGLRLLGERAKPPHKRELVVEHTRVGPAQPRRALGRSHKITAAQLRGAQAAMRKPETNVADLCAKLGISRQTMYRYLDPLGELRPNGLRLLGERGISPHKRELVVERTRVGPPQPRARSIPRKMTAAQLLIAQAAMGKPETKVSGLCAELGISAQTLYRHVDPRGELRPAGIRLLGMRSTRPPKPPPE